jgi:hypothetical protein
MKKLLTILCGISLWILISANASALPIEKITNGDFESGSFTGWDIFPISEGAWVINSYAGNLPPPPYVDHDPIAGNYDARVLPTSSGSTYSILQPIMDISSGTITSAILSWSDRIENYTPPPDDPTREFRADLLGDTDVFEIFSTQSSDFPSQVGPNERNYDVTGILNSLAGQSVKLRFQNITKGPLSVTLDNISLEVEITPVPEPATILLLSTGLIGLAGFGRKKRSC